MDGELHENAAGGGDSDGCEGHIEGIEHVGGERVVVAERDCVDVDGDGAPPAAQQQQYQPKYQPHKY